jgi:hypothetical protein
VVAESRCAPLVPVATGAATERRPPRRSEGGSASRASTGRHRGQALGVAPARRRRASQRRGRRRSHTPGGGRGNGIPLGVVQGWYGMLSGLWPTEPLRSLKHIFPLHSPKPPNTLLPESGMFASAFRTRTLLIRLPHTLLLNTHAS